MFKKLRRNLALALTASMVVTMINPCFGAVETKGVETTSIYEPENPAVYEFGFEEDPFENGWTQVDNDGDGYTWNWVYYDDGNEYANSGLGCMRSDSYYEGGLTPDNILISPKITCDKDYNVSFYAMSYDSNYLEQFALYAGTSTNIDDMTMLTDDYVVVGANYTKFEYSLENFTGEEIYIAIRHSNVTDQWRWSLDDFKVIDNAIAERENEKKLIEEEEAKEYLKNIFFEDFEEDPFEKGWTEIDSDGDGYNWTWYQNEESDPDSYKRLSGVGLIYSESYINNLGALKPDNYLISPGISLKDVDPNSECYLEINAIGQDPSYPNEIFAVYAGTSDNIDDMEMISDEEITTSGEYEKYSFSLNEYIGEENVYFAIRHYRVTDQFRIHLDDIKVVEESNRDKGNFAIDLSEGDVTIDCANYSYKRTQNIAGIILSYSFYMMGEDKAEITDGVSYFDINGDGIYDFTMRSDESNTYPVIYIEKTSTCSAYGSEEYILSEDQIEEVKTITEGIPYYSGIEIELGDKRTELTSSNTTITFKNTYYATGNEIIPSVTVKYGETPLIENTDYTISFSDNVAVGTGKIKITGKGDYSGEVNGTFVINKFTPATVDDVEIKCYYDINDFDLYNIVTDGEKVEGITWDKENATLTLSNYNGGPIWIDSTNRFDASPKINVVVNGENTISANNSSKWNQQPLFLFEDIDATITGTGTLTINGFEPNDQLYHDYSIDCYGNLTIDGPTLVLNYVYDAIYVRSAEVYTLKDNGTLREDSFGGTLTVNSGNVVINSNTKLNYDKKYVDTYAITANEISLNGGCVYISNQNIYPDENINHDIFGIIESSDGITTGNVKIIIVNDEVYENVELMHSYDGEDAITIGEDTQIIVLKNSEATIDKFEAVLSDTEFAYDGKDKKPKVYVDGLLEGIHYEVIYEEDTKSVGEKTVVVKGIGDFSGEITLTYVILEKVDDNTGDDGNKDDGKNNDGTETVADGPKAGTTIKDKKYIYKVTKAGSTDGTVIGELEVSGLKKKSLTQIKIATTTTINGVKYKITSVGAKAFKGNKKITKVFVGKNVVKIGANAFAGCTKLKQVSINSKVLKEIGKNAFKGDKKLKKIIIKSAKLKKIKKGALKRTSKKLVVKVPKAKKKAYAKLVKKAGNKKAKVK